MEAKYCKPTEIGVKAGGISYPYTTKESPSDDLTVYVIPIEPVPLLDHNAIEKHRDHVDFLSLYQPTSDWLEYARGAALVFGLGVCLWATMTIGNMTSMTTQMAVNQNAIIERLNAIDDRLDQPLIIEEK